jgi:ribonuclease HII
MELPPLSELRIRYVDRGRPVPGEVEAALRADPRSGAQQLLAAIERRRHERRAEGQRMRKILRYEQDLWNAGHTHVAGVDEAGMSPLAGPVCAASVILPVGCRIAGVDDSKKLTAERREELAAEIRSVAVAWHVAYAEPEEIDRINIYWAGILAMRRAVEGLSLRPHHLLIDARKLKDIDLPQTSIVHGDALSASIAAASILAKTSRDALMRELDAAYPGYGFCRHKGYPVKEHQDALKKLGATPHHRRSFAPVRAALGLPPLKPEDDPPAPKSNTRRKAAARAAVIEAAPTSPRRGALQAKSARSA